MAQHTHPQLDLAVAEARAARERSYAPYSNFDMGAAIATSRQLIVPGALVENISFGLAMCAERAALFSGVATAAGRPELLVLVAARTNDGLTWPCGACLQVALELGGPSLLVAAADPSGNVEVRRIGELAPKLPFKAGKI